MPHTLVVRIEDCNTKLIAQRACHAIDTSESQMRAHESHRLVSSAAQLRTIGCVGVTLIVQLAFELISGLTDAGASRGQRPSALSLPSTRAQGFEMLRHSSGAIPAVPLQGSHGITRFTRVNESACASPFSTERLRDAIADGLELPTPSAILTSKYGLPINPFRRIQWANLGHYPGANRGH